MQEGTLYGAPTKLVIADALRIKNDSAISGANAATATITASSLTLAKSYPANHHHCMNASTSSTDTGANRNRACSGGTTTITYRFNHLANKGKFQTVRFYDGAGATGDYFNVGFNNITYPGTTNWYSRQYQNGVATNYEHTGVTYPTASGWYEVEIDISVWDWRWRAVGGTWSSWYPIAGVADKPTYQGAIATIMVLNAADSGTKNFLVDDIVVTGGSSDDFSSYADTTAMLATWSGGALSYVLDTTQGYAGTGHGHTYDSVVKNFVDYTSVTALQAALPTTEGWSSSVLNGNGFWLCNDLVEIGATNCLDVNLDNHIKGTELLEVGNGTLTYIAKAAVETGLSGSRTSATVYTVSGKTWIPYQWEHYTLRVGSVDYPIVSNTADTITIHSDYSIPSDAGATWYIYEGWGKYYLEFAPISDNDYPYFVPPANDQIEIAAMTYVGASFDRGFTLKAGTTEIASYYPEGDSAALMGELGYDAKYAMYFYRGTDFTSGSTQARFYPVSSSYLNTFALDSFRIGTNAAPYKISNYDTFLTIYADYWSANQSKRQSRFVGEYSPKSRTLTGLTAAYNRRQEASWSSAISPRLSSTQWQTEIIRLADWLVANQNGDGTWQTASNFFIMDCCAYEWLGLQDAYSITNNANYATAIDLVATAFKTGVLQHEWHLRNKVKFDTADTTNFAWAGTWSRLTDTVYAKGFFDKATVNGSTVTFTIPSGGFSGGTGAIKIWSIFNTSQDGFHVEYDLTGSSGWTTDTANNILPWDNHYSFNGSVSYARPIYYREGFSEGGKIRLTAHISDYTYSGFDLLEYGTTDKRNYAQSPLNHTSGAYSYFECFNKSLLLALAMAKHAELRNDSALNFYAKAIATYVADLVDAGGDAPYGQDFTDSKFPAETFNRRYNGLNGVLYSIFYKQYKNNINFPDATFSTFCKDVADRLAIAETMPEYYAESTGDRRSATSHAAHSMILWDEDGDNLERFEIDKTYSQLPLRIIDTISRDFAAGMGQLVSYNDFAYGSPLWQCQAGILPNQVLVSGDSDLCFYSDTQNKKSWFCDTTLDFDNLVASSNIKANRRLYPATEPSSSNSYGNIRLARNGTTAAAKCVRLATTTNTSYCYRDTAANSKRISFWINIPFTKGTEASISLYSGTGASGNYFKFGYSSSYSNYWSYGNNTILANTGIELPSAELHFVELEIDTYMLHSNALKTGFRFRVDGGTWRIYGATYDDMTAVGTYTNADIVVKNFRSVKLYVNGTCSWEFDGIWIENEWYETFDDVNLTGWTLGGDVSPSQQTMGVSEPAYQTSGYYAKVFDAGADFQPKLSVTPNLKSNVESGMASTVRIGDGTYMFDNALATCFASKPLLTTTTTEMTTASNTVTVVDASGIAVDDYIVIGSECLKVTSKDSNVLTLNTTTSRNKLGSTLSHHLSGSAICHMPKSTWFSDWNSDDNDWKTWANLTTNRFFFTRMKLEAPVADFSPEVLEFALNFELFITQVTDAALSCTRIKVAAISKTALSTTRILAKATKTALAVVRIKTLALAKSSLSILRIKVASVTKTALSTTRIKILAITKSALSNVRIRLPGITKTALSFVRIKVFDITRTALSTTRIKIASITNTALSIARIKVANTKSTLSVTRIKQLDLLVSTLSALRIKVAAITDTALSKLQIKIIGITKTALSILRVLTSGTQVSLSKTRIKVLTITKTSLSKIRIKVAAITRPALSILRIKIAKVTNRALSKLRIKTTGQVTQYNLDELGRHIYAGLTEQGRGVFTVLTETGRRVFAGLVSLVSKNGLSRVRIKVSQIGKFALSTLRVKTKAVTTAALSRVRVYIKATKYALSQARIKRILAVYSLSRTRIKFIASKFALSKMRIRTLAVTRSALSTLRIKIARINNTSLSKLRIKTAKVTNRALSLLRIKSTGAISQRNFEETGRFIYNNLTENGHKAFAVLTETGRRSFAALVSLVNKQALALVRIKVFDITRTALSTARIKIANITNATLSQTRIKVVAAKNTLSVVRVKQLDRLKTALSVLRIKIRAITNSALSTMRIESAAIIASALSVVRIYTTKIVAGLSLIRIQVIGTVIQESLSLIRVKIIEITRNSLSAARIKTAGLTQSALSLLRTKAIQTGDALSLLRVGTTGQVRNALSFLRIKILDITYTALSIARIKTAGLIQNALSIGRIKTIVSQRALSIVRILTKKTVSTLGVLRIKRKLITKPALSTLRVKWVAILSLALSTTRIKIAELIKSGLCLLRIKRLAVASAALSVMYVNYPSGGFRKMDKSSDRRMKHEPKEMNYGRPGRFAAENR